MAPSYDGFNAKIAPDGTGIGTRALVDIFFDPNLGPVLQDSAGNYWRLVVDTNGVIGAQSITLTQ